MNRNKTFARYVQGYYTLHYFSTEAWAKKGNPPIDIVIEFRARWWANEPEAGIPAHWELESYKVTESYAPIPLPDRVAIPSNKELTAWLEEEVNIALDSMNIPQFEAEIIEIIEDLYTPYDDREEPEAEPEPHGSRDTFAPRPYDAPPSDNSHPNKDTDQ